MTDLRNVLDAVTLLQNIFLLNNFHNVNSYWHLWFKETHFLYTLLCVYNSGGRDVFVIFSQNFVPSLTVKSIYYYSLRSVKDMPLCLATAVKLSVAISTGQLVLFIKMKRPTLFTVLWSISHVFQNKTSHQYENLLHLANLVLIIQKGKHYY
jgi:hypothetical protein